MDHSKYLEIYECYLREEKKASANTLSSYLRDIRQYGEYLDGHEEIDFDEETLERGSIKCPNCGELLEFTTEE